MSTKISLSEKFIRKAWFILLRHLKENPAFYLDDFRNSGITNLKKLGITNLRELGVTNLKEFLDSGIEIIHHSKDNFLFHDEAEREWHENGSISINFVAKIRHGYEAEICAIINNKVLEGRVRKDSKILSPKQLSKGGVAQTVFNIAATNWELNPYNIKISFNKSLEKEVNYKKILGLYQYVNKISIYFPGENSKINSEIQFLRKEIEKEFLNKSNHLESKQSNIGLQNHYKAWAKLNNFPKSLFNSKWLDLESYWTKQ